MQLDNRIRKVGDLAREAFVELNKLQKREKLLLKTGQEMIDCHIGGLLAGDVVVIGGLPSTGKSETLYRTLEKIMDTKINRDADKYVSLEYSMEMKMLNKLLRSTHNMLGKKKSDILFNPFNEEEAIKVANYYENLKDDRRYAVQSPVTPEEFYNMTADFCRLHKDKEAIIISADHLLLFSGSEKQGVLEKVSECINLLKLEFPNVFFLLLSQLNRSALAVIKEKSNESIPNNSQLFGSSFMEQLASYIILITNPFKQSITQYLKVNKDRYDYLTEFYGEEDSGDRVSFETIGNLFYFVTKTRESDVPYQDLFIKKMDLSEEQLSKMKQSIDNKNTFTPSYPIDIPVFNSTMTVEKPSIVTPNFDLASAFDAPVIPQKTDAFAPNDAIFDNNPDDSDVPF